MSTTTASANQSGDGTVGALSNHDNDEDIENILKGTFIMGMVGLVPVVFNCQGTICAALMAAFACFGVGAVVGLLFGIPRSLQGNGASARPSDDTARDQAYGDNSNLEQISDWLTKILVGASLVQMREIKDLLVKLANRLAGTPRADQAFAFSLFVIIYFLVLGFVSSYLLARIWMPVVLKRGLDAASPTRKILQGLTEQAKGAMERATAAVEQGKQVAELTLMLGRMSGTVDLQPPPQEGKSGVSGTLASQGATVSTAAQQAEAQSDPNEGKFGRQAKAKGRILSATVSEIPGSTEQFAVRIEVKSDSDTPLDRPVTFHLHPTFREPKVTVVPSAGIALLERICWGAFTVGVETDDGKTRLELDLALLPGVPQKFASR